jgi:hypothetical protein
MQEVPAYKLLTFWQQFGDKVIHGPGNGNWETRESGTERRAFANGGGTGWGQ